MPNEFNSESWHNICDAFATEAARRCGQSDVLYTKLVSQAIATELTKIPQAHKEDGIRIAREFDYCTPEELRADDVQAKDMGYCAHGLAPNCCPVGCGDLDD